MHQVAANVWNQIGSTVPLATGWAQQMFPLPPQDLEKALQVEETRIATEAAAMEPKAEQPDYLTAGAYLLVMPLLWEHEAISQFLTEHPEMQRALPTVETVQDAVDLASEEFVLDSTQRQKLGALLQQEPN